jgi:hypothetical protein
MAIDGFPERRNARFLSSTDGGQPLLISATGEAGED